MSPSKTFRTRYRKFLAFLLPVHSGVPEELSSNFRHLYWDIAWWGLLNGSSLAFLTIYAARLGANTNQIGLVNAMPAVITLALALPAGAWLEKRRIDKTVFWTAISQRIFYLFMVILPWFFSDKMQIWILIAFTLIMSIPGSIIATGFNVLFATAVPSRYRAMVAGRRNAVFAVITVITSLVCGRILTWMPFPGGYQVVFAIGFIGALMSAIHLRLVHPVLDETDVLNIPVVSSSNPEEQQSPKRGRLLNNLRSRLHTEALQGEFARALLLLTFFHFIHYLSIPLFPVFSVKTLNLSDQTISLGTALFYVTMFIGSTQMVTFSARLGNKKLTGIGICLLGLYPGLLSFANGPLLFYLASLFGGFAWSLVNVGMINYLLEKVPSNQRASYLAWFTLSTNAAILAGTMLGPVIGNWTGLATALLIFGILRAVAGLSVLRWG
ncbi:MAG: hypothetical protein CVU39_24420 [Chloroflexi bacterium HGW-Chloroflexi-10]|nr:MAG: hypothetical protein CVU39_24420 [Chloroflexi bacterium HGW-Chloroflexi-10]